MLQALIDKSQEHVSGKVRVKLYKGNATVIGREQPARPLRPGSRHLRGRLVGYDQRDAAGFIRLNALRLRTLATRNRRDG